MLVVGARPNFIKIAPIMRALRAAGAFDLMLVHTGQHYDAAMSDVFFAELALPDPDIHLGVGPGSHAVQTGAVMQAMEPVIERTSPDLVTVVGDVNSTLAAALVAVKKGIPVAHVEAGLRSFDRTMPEEINRVLTDQISDLLFTTEQEAERNLVREGIAASRVVFVGNVMIDSMLHALPRAVPPEQLIARYATDTSSWTPDRGFAAATLHRPSNVDDPERLERIVDSLVSLAGHAPVVFPIHPRTRARLTDDGGLSRLETAGVACIEPAAYLEFLSLQSGAGAIVTDSGGIQEEASALGISCYTFRPNTERPVTLTHGTNLLLGEDPAEITEVRPASHPPTPSAIPLWDGHAGERVADALVANYAMVSRHAGAHG
jgi:UDP-N-acetylglucosamine 2-epimerase (non-hydrolysing)